MTNARLLMKTKHCISIIKVNCICLKHMLMLVKYEMYNIWHLLQTSLRMNHTDKNKKRGTEGLCSPVADRVSQWESLPENDENCSPVATSSPLLCRKLKKRKRVKLSSEKLLKHEQSRNFEKYISDDSKNESSLLIKDDSFINHINFEKLDQLSAPSDGSNSSPAAPASPQLFEEPSPIKTCESQSVIFPTQASLSSTLSSQPLVTRIQRSFKSGKGESQKMAIFQVNHEIGTKLVGINISVIINWSDVHHHCMS